MTPNALRAQVHDAYNKLLVASITLDDCGVAENEGAILIVKEVKSSLWEVFEGLEKLAEKEPQEAAAEG